MPGTLFRTFDTLFDKTVVLSYTLANLDATVNLLPGTKGSTQDRQRLWDECVRLTAPPEGRVS
jgi:hypothetical protein